MAARRSSSPSFFCDAGQVSKSYSNIITAEDSPAAGAAGVAGPGSVVDVVAEGADADAEAGLGSSAGSDGLALPSNVILLSTVMY